VAEQEVNPPDKPPRALGRKKPFCCGGQNPAGNFFKPALTVLHCTPDHIRHTRQGPEFKNNRPMYRSTEGSYDIEGGIGFGPSPENTGL